MPSEGNILLEDAPVELELTSRSEDKGSSSGLSYPPTRKEVITHPALQRFRRIKKVNLVNALTPVELCDRLGKAIAGAPNIYIKRDDCLGYLVGGNKLRKCEYLMTDVLRKKATTVITIGSVESNHARVLAMTARRLGLNCVLVLNGKIPNRPSGNIHINRLLGVKVYLVETRRQRDAMMNEIAEDLERKGEKVYRVPLGVSDEIGSFGLVAAFEEVCRQQRAMGIRFDAIIFASSSGGTQAGLEVGKRLFNQDDLQIIGISPDDPSKVIRNNVLRAMRAMLARLGMDQEVDQGELCIDDRYVGRGYGIQTEGSAEAACLFSRTEGILLDPVYTSKAAAALIDYCRAKKFQPTDRVLFWHTGGLLALFR